MNPELESLLTPTFKLSRDMVKALRQQGTGLSASEARYLVDVYYQMQDQRIRTGNQCKALDRDATKSGTEAEPHDALDWVRTQFATLEQQVAKLLSIYVEGHPMAWFFDRTIGIGPVLAAGLLAHIDITKAPTAGHIYSFAGLNPTQKWEKGKKRPHNAELKKLCWKIGESFVKTSTHPDGYYGRVYKTRKAQEWERNMAGELVDQAQGKLEAFKMGKDTDAFAWYSGQCEPAKVRACLESGTAPTPALCKGENGVAMLPPAHIHTRATRYAVKLFLSHLQECWYREAYGCEPPAPYVISHGGHAHYIRPPQLPITH